MRRILALSLLGLLCACTFFGQSLGNAGTVEGTVTDASGAAVPKAQITIHNSVTNYRQATVSGSDGTFRLTNLPPNSYHLEIRASGFDPFVQDIAIRSAVPFQVKASLTVAGSNTNITVEAGGADLLEVEPSAHVDVDRNQLAKLPALDPGAGLSQAIVYSTGGVAADGNGLFHPLGDHAQVSFVVDGQPISDQQSKVFSTQLPTSAIQGMELITGSPDAEFGDKTSLVAQITTRSGLGAPKLFGNIDASYGSFGTTGGGISLGWGSAKFGNFVAVEGTRSGRFLDSPEFTPFHDKGNNQTFFDRIDAQPNGKDALHLNLFAARNWIQIPNSYDQLGQDQRQRVMTWSIAPGYQHTVNSHTLITINPYVRKDEFNYYGSRDPFADTPATQSQSRQLLNWGVRADVAITKGRHNIKIGTDLKQTRLLENFGFGITDATYNPICVDQSGGEAGPLTITDPNQCAGLGLLANPNLQPGLIPYDLTRGGSLLTFHATHNINQYAGYAQDSITAGRFLFNIGFRADRYDGLSTNNGAEPRAGIAYNLKKTGTVLRVAYSRTFETPFNENLLLSSATGIGGLAANVFGATAVPIPAGRRNQFNTGFQQAIGRHLLIDADYFWKFTHSAYDFSTLLNTTITFPVSWHNSKIDGFTGRVSTANLGGFQAYWTFGHSRARYFPPEIGGLVPQGASIGDTVFRIDHDQAFQSTATFRYQHKRAEWIALTWRYDSGLVVSGVPDVDAALALTAAQQVSIGFACNGVFATFAVPITTCNGKGTSTLLTLPQSGEENDDHNPDRVKARHVFNLGLGTDNLLHSEKNTKVTASIDIANLGNVVALYNFLSTFSGTHFLQPRTVVARIGLSF
jgi:Carboxypeptidase regulatory-like domain